MSDTQREIEQTKYGFRAGNVLVTRYGSFKRSYIVVIETPKQAIQVAVSPTGLIKTYQYKNTNELFEQSCKDSGCKKEAK